MNRESKSAGASRPPSGDKRQSSAPGAGVSGPQKEEAIKVDGVVTQLLPGTMFRVDVGGGHEVLAHISGKMRKHFIRIMVGDKVSMEMSPYDMTKARITYRHKT